MILLLLLLLVLTGDICGDDVVDGMIGVQKGIENLAPLVDPIGTLYGRGFHKRYLTDIKVGQSDCFFFDALRENQVLAVHYIILSTGARGQKLTASASILSPTKTSLQFQRDQHQGMMAVHVKQEGDYAVCINNTYSKITTSGSLRISWDLEIQPAIRDLQEVKRASREYQKDSKEVETGINKVHGKVILVQHELWKLTGAWKSDSYRVDTLQSMITRWSLIQSAVVIFIYIAQCYVLKSFFSSEISTETRMDHSIERFS